MGKNLKKVYGLIGVIGSGKGYTSDLIKFDNKHLRVSELDFSDGVRKVTYKHLGIQPPEDYRNWKDSNVNGMKGREWLEYVGEGIRGVVPSFWAEYCKEEAEKLVDNTDVFIFGSVRNQYEARVVIDFAKQNGCTLQFIFTNFKSEFYELRDNPSEYFAQSFLKLGCENLEDITLRVIEECKI